MYTRLVFLEPKNCYRLIFFSSCVPRCGPYHFSIIFPRILFPCPQAKATFCTSRRVACTVCSRPCLAELSYKIFFQAPGSTIRMCSNPLPLNLASLHHPQGVKAQRGNQQSVILLEATGRGNGSPAGAALMHSSQTTPRKLGFGLPGDSPSTLSSLRDMLLQRR